MPTSTITLAVNVDNDDGTTAAIDKIYSLFDASPQNRVDYISESHTLALRDTLKLYRTPPKKSGNFRGTAKTAVKFTEDFEVDGVDSTTTVTAPGILDISFSCPIGMTPAQTLEMRMNAVALLQDNDIMAALVDQQLLAV